MKRIIRNCIIACFLIMILNYAVKIENYKSSNKIETINALNMDVGVLDVFDDVYRKELQIKDDEKEKLRKEFVAKVEDTYSYELWYWGDGIYITSMGYRREDLEVELVKSEKGFYFWPVEESDTEINIGGKTIGIPANSFQEGKYCLWKLEPYKGWMTGRWRINYDGVVSERELIDCAYLGTVTINTLGTDKPECAELTKNPAIDAMTEYFVEQGQRGRLPSGKYRMYIGGYMYSADKYGNYIYMEGILESDDGKRIFSGGVKRERDGTYTAYCLITSGGSVDDEWFPFAENPKEYEQAEHIIEANRLVIDFTI